MTCVSTIIRLQDFSVIHANSTCAKTNLFLQMLTSWQLKCNGLFKRTTYTYTIMFHPNSASRKLQINFTQMTQESLTVLVLRYLVTFTESNKANNIIVMRIIFTKWQFTNDHTY